MILLIPAGMPMDRICAAIPRFGLQSDGLIDKAVFFERKKGLYSRFSGKEAFGKDRERPVATCRRQGKS
jgi:hypothetical protein